MTNDSDLIDPCTPNTPLSKKDGDFGKITQLMKTSLNNNEIDKGVKLAYDSLKLVINSKNNNLIAEGYKNIAVAMICQKKYDLGVRVFKHCLQYFEADNNLEQLAVCYYEIGRAYCSMQDIDESIKYYNQAKDLFHKTKNSKFESYTLINVGVNYGMLENYEDSLSCFNSALSIISRQGSNQDLFDIYIDIGNIQLLDKKYNDALRSYQDAKLIFEQDNSISGLENIYNNIGFCYESLNQFELSKEYLIKALSIKLDKDLTNTNTTYFALAKLHKNMKEYDLAKDYIIQALIIFEQSEVNINKSKYYLLYSEILMLLEEYDLSKSVLEIALGNLDTAAHYNQSCLNLYEHAYKLHEKLKEFEQAFYYHKLYFEQKNIELQKRLGSQYFVEISKYKVVQKEHENEIFRLRNVELKKLNDTKNKIFSILAHDLNNYLTKVISGSKILSRYGDKLSKDELVFTAKSLSGDSTQVLHLLKNVLKWARSQMGLIPFNQSNVNLYLIVNEVIEIMDVIANSKNISIVSDCPKNLTGFVDKSMLISILNGLIYNSIKFSKEDSQISICVSKVGEFIQFSVVDQGVGISKDNMDILFELDKHIVTKGTNNEKGTGLGLILCKDFIDKNGGEIWVESQLDIGTKVHFTVPGHISE